MRGYSRVAILAALMATAGADPRAADHLNRQLPRMDPPDLPPLTLHGRAEAEARLRDAERRLSSAGTPGARRKAQRTVDALRAAVDRLDTLSPSTEGDR